MRAPNKTLIVICLLIIWWGASWLIEDAQYRDRTGSMIEQAEKHANTQALDLADSLYKKLDYISNTPKFLSNLLRVRRAVQRFQFSKANSSYEVSKKTWTDDPDLNNLSQLLATAENDFNADSIFILNIAGDCIAASNWNKAGSPIGTNFADREYFSENQAGKDAVQYAVGRTTHIPGLYFTSPIMLDGHFMGTVVSKLDVPSLSYLFNNSDAYLVDSNGMIILAHEKPFEMHALPGSPLLKMSAEAKKFIYRTSEIPTIQIDYWNKDQFPALRVINQESIPHIQAHKAVPIAGLTLYVEAELPFFAKLARDRIWLFLFIGILGSSLIGTVLAIAFYVRSIHQSKRLSEENTARLNESQVAAKIGNWQLNTDTQVTTWSENLFNLLELDATQHTAEHATLLAVVHPDDRTMVSTAHQKFLDTHEPVNLEYRLCMPDKPMKFISEHCHCTFDDNGNPLIFHGTLQDVTENRQAEKSMRLAALIYQTSLAAVIITDKNNLIVDVNPAFTKQTGYTLAEVSRKNPRIFQSGKHDRAFYSKMWDAILSQGHWEGELHDLRKDGSEHIKLTSISVIRHLDGSVYRYVAQFSDITNRKNQEELIWKQANFDTLSGLPNRRMFHDRLELEIRKSHRSGLTLALMFLDLDRFKQVNDKFGHEKGDILLIEAGRRISQCIRETDMVARLGGDEFTIILADFINTSALERIAENILCALSQPFDLGNHQTAHISASIGISLLPNDASDSSELMIHADQALYLSKAEGRNKFSYFSPAIQHAMLEKLSLISDLRQALSHHELEVYFQPIVEMNSGLIAKAEALLRWKHPVRGEISPAVFIALAEESGQILEIGEWVFQEVIDCIEQWQKQYGRHLQISVNMSPLQFEKTSHHAWLDKLASSDLPADSLVIEITEGLLIKDSSKVTEKLDIFRQHGIKISIDDFGTGFSSLAYLKKFDIDYLKIDRTFINQLHEDKNDRALTESIIMMAHKLGIKTIAEGVKIMAQHDLLASFGSDYSQGFLYSNPLPKTEFESLILTSKNISLIPPHPLTE